MADLDLVIFGPPGAGKGTQAEPLAAARGLRHLSTGALLRSAVAAGSPAGAQAQRYMDAGGLVPDDVVVELVVEEVEHAGSGGLLLDGFPRTLAQAQALDDTLKRLGRPPVKAILIDVPDDVLVARLAGRRVCELNGHDYHLEYHPPREPGICDIDGSPLIRRSDDEPDVILRRLAVYHEDTQPLIAYYRDREALVRVSGVDDPDTIRAQIAAALEPRPS